MKKITIEEILDMVWNNGLEYTILEGINFEDIEDNKLKKLFQQAYESLKEIDSILETYSIEDDSYKSEEDYPENEQLSFDFFNLDDDDGA